MDRKVRTLYSGFFGLPLGCQLPYFILTILKKQVNVTIPFHLESFILSSTSSKKEQYKKEAMLQWQYGRHSSSVYIQETNNWI